MLTQLVLGFAIGLSLGLLGGGGSILTVPALVYVVGYSPGAAVTASLAIVGMNSLSGVLVHRKQGTLNWRVALAFGGAGMVAAYFAARLSHFFPPPVLMVAFALLMLAVGMMMLRSRHADDAHVEPRSLAATLTAGAGVGALTGFLGVGGGFLIVPALVMLVGLPMPVAVGTSLLVIAMNSLSGLLGHLNDVPLDWQLIASFTLAGIVGAFVGARLARLIHPDRLRQVFGLFVIILGAYLLYDNATKLLR